MRMRGSGRVISGVLVSAGVCSALALAGVSAGAVLAQAEPGAAAGGGAPAATTRAGMCRGAGNGGGRTVPVIVFLKKQWAGAGTQIRSDKRGALIQTAQAPV